MLAARPVVFDCYVKFLNLAPSLVLLGILEVDFKIKPHVNVNLLLMCSIIICENCWETAPGQHPSVSLYSWL